MIDVVIYSISPILGNQFVHALLTRFVSKLSLPHAFNLEMRPTRHVTRSDPVDHLPVG